MQPQRQKRVSLFVSYQAIRYLSMYVSSDNHVYSLQSGWTLCGYNIVDGVVLRTGTVWITDRDPHLFCFSLTKYFFVGVMNDDEDQLGLLYNAAATTQAGEFYLYHMTLIRIVIVLYYCITLYYFIQTDNVFVFCRRIICRSR